jgi:diguanylate cyclase (GGDEF)-like protein
MSDEELLRNTIESLIHGSQSGETAESTGEHHEPQASETRAPHWRVAEAKGAQAGPGDSAVKPGAMRDPLTGLYGASAWAQLIATETARIERYQRPAVAIQLELGQVSTVSDPRSEPVPEHLIIELAAVIATSTRRTDGYAFFAPKRIQGILVETTAEGAISCTRRIRDRFFTVVHGPVTLRAGHHPVNAGAGVQAALGKAEEQLHRHEPSTGGPEGSIREKLTELKALREDGLIDDAEYNSKRDEVLRLL